MKKTNRVVTTFEVTADEMRENLALYQADQLNELVVSYIAEIRKQAEVNVKGLTNTQLGNTITTSERDQFMLKLLQESEYGDWFQDLVEKHSICWIHTPSRDQELFDLITNHPYIFGIGGEIDLYAINISRGGDEFDHTDFEVIVDGTRLCSKTIWENI
jgi:hypothetical protein